MTALEIGSIVAGVIVGITLVVSGVLKIRDGDAWPKQAADMGVGKATARLVPWVELAVGTAAAAQLLRPWSAVAAGLLLLAFTVVICLRLLDGTRPPCACFGSRSTRPLGAYHVVRNVLLLALSMLAILGA